MRLTILCACVLAVARLGTAQESATAKQPTQASLEGSVIKEPSGEPLKKAIIELIAENQEEGSNYTATSDQDGHFKIAGIQPGRYRMFAERSGYIQVDKKRRRSEMITFSFGAGEELKDQVLHMLAAAILTGRVLDEDGDPISDADVKVFRRKFGGGRSNLQIRGAGQTNDLGEFRIGGVLAGKYYVSVSPPQNFAGLMVQQKRGEEAGTPSTDMEYVTTYYPNTIDRSQAALVELHPGDETPVNFSLARTHTARVRGSVAGLPAGVKAVVMLRARDSNAMFIGGEVDKDGKFEIPHVAPGRYAVVATTENVDAPLSACRSIEVTDANVDGLSLLPFTGTTIRGRVRFTGKVKVKSSSLFVTLIRIDGEDDFPDGTFFSEDGIDTPSAFGRLKDDGSIELKDVPPGLYEMLVYGDSKGMADTLVESIVVGTRDVVDTGLNLTGGTLIVDLTVGLDAGVVDGTVTNDKKEPLANTMVVAVPEAKYRKRQSHYQKTATDQYGRFTLHGLRPGEYTLYAWEALEGDEYLDPDFLKPIKSQGVEVKVEKSSHQTVPLKVITPPADQP